MVRRALPLCLALSGLVTAWAGCGDDAPAGAVTMCSGDADCPAGASCVDGVCLPDEFSPIALPDGGTEGEGEGVEGEGEGVEGEGEGVEGEGEGVEGEGEGVEGEGEGVEGEGEGGEGEGEGGEGEGEGGEGEGEGGIVRPLALSWVLPAEQARVEGEAELQLQIAADPRLAPRLLVLTVDGVEALRLGMPEAGEPSVLRLDTRDYPDGRHQLAATIQDLGGRVAEAPARTLIFSNHPRRLQTEQGRFVLDAAPVGLLGVEYVVPADDVTLDADLAAMTAAGINLLAVAAPSTEVEPAENVFALQGCLPITRLLDHAAARELRVLLLLPPATAYPYLQPAPGVVAGPSAPLWDAKLRSALARRWANVLERCAWADREELAGLELWRAPRQGAEAERLGTQAIAAWEQWSVARHGDLAARAAAWGADAPPLSCGATGQAACPPPTAALCAAGVAGSAPSRALRDYRDFQAQLGLTALQDLAVKIGSVEPLLLLGAGLEAPLAAPPADVRARCVAEGDPLDPRAVAAPLDFVLLVGQPWQGVTRTPQDPTPLDPAEAGHATDFDGYELSALWARGAADERPLLLGGFVADAALAGGGAAGQALQAGIWSRVLLAATELQLAGVVAPSWRDPAGGESAPSTGLMGPDGARPALALLSQAAALLAAAAWTPLGWLAVPEQQTPALAEALLLAQPFLAPLRGAHGSPALTSCALPPELSCAEVAGCTELCPDAAE